MDGIAHRAVRLFRGEPESLEFVQHVANEVWRFRRDGDVAYLRLSHASRVGLARTRCELAWMRYLRDAGLRVVPPLASTRGELVETVDDRLVCAFAAARGRMPDYDARVAAVPSRDWTREHRIEIGATLGRLHRLTAAWSERGTCDRRPWTEDDALTTPLPLELAREREEVLRWMRALPQDAFGLVHADVLPGNWMLDGDRLELLDFDDSHYGWHAYDLAVPLYCFTHAPVIVKSVGPTPGLLDDLLEGYQQAWPMAPAWQSRIPGFVRFRRMLVLADCHRLGRTENDWYRYHLRQLSRREPLT